MQSNTNKEDLLNNLLNEIKELQNSVVQLKIEINKLKSKETLFGPSNIHYPENFQLKPIATNDRIVKCYNVYGDSYETDILTGEVIQRTHGL